MTYTTATLTNVTFRNNSALTYGGAMLSVAAYVTCKMAPHHFFIHTTTSVGPVGVVTLLPVCRVPVTGCKFISNAAGMGGGAMAVVQASGTMDITYCVFRDNSAG